VICYSKLRKVISNSRKFIETLTKEENSKLKRKEQRVHKPMVGLRRIKKYCPLELT